MLREYQPGMHGELGMQMDDSVMLVPNVAFGPQ